MSSSQARPTHQARASSGSAPRPTSRRGSSSVAALTLALASITGCFTGTFLEGKQCKSDADCGPDLECVNGYCGGAVPETPTTGGATTGATSTGAPETTETTAAPTTTLEPTTDVEPTTEDPSTTGPQCECQALDILLVYDQSELSNMFLNKIVGVLVELSTQLQESLANVCSYHVGLTFTSEVLHNDPGAQDIGCLLTYNKMEDCRPLMGGKAYIDENDSLTDALLCLVSSGPTGEEPEQNARPAMALQKALEPERNAPGGCNEGFFRPEAALAVTLVTANNDDRDGHPMGNGSPGEPNQWFTQIIEYNELDPGRVGIAGVLPPSTKNPMCAAEESPRLHEFMDFFVDDNTIVMDICDDEAVIVEEFSTNLQERLFNNTCQ